MRYILIPILAFFFTVAPQAADTDKKAEFKVAYNAYQTAIAEGDVNAAKDLSKTAYELGRSVYGEDHINTAMLALNYSRELYPSEKNKAQLKKALQVFETKYGKDSEDLIDILMEIGSTISSAGKYTEKKAHIRALNIAKTHHGANSATVGSIYLDIGKTYLTQFSSTRAITYLKKAKDIFETIKGEKSEIWLAKTNFWLGKYKLAKKQNQAAETDLLKALETFESYAPNASMTMSTHAFLIETYERQGKREEATKHCLAIGQAQPHKDNQNYIPVFRKSPTYPMNARQARKEGYTIIELTVDTNGFVKNPQVTETKGSKNFAKAAMAVIEGFRYIPRFENGKPVESTGVKYKFSFDIAN